jgi:hypothetical protein
VNASNYKFYIIAFESEINKIVGVTPASTKGMHEIVSDIVYFRY